VNTRNSNISGLVLVGNHSNITLQSLLFADPVNVFSVSAATAKTLTFVDQHITISCALITHTVPVIQGASQLLFASQANAYGLRPFASGLRQEALVAVVSKIVGIQFSQRCNES